MVSSLGRVAALASLVFALATASAPAQLPDIGSGLPVPPIPSGLPTISGTPATGSTLTCVNPAWLGAPTSYTYAWLRNTEAVAGATSTTYTVLESDRDKLIQCRVAATNAAGTTPADSLPVTPVLGLPTGGAPTVAPTPTVQVGQQAQCKPGIWINSTGATRSYEWFGNGTKIASTQDYLVKAADAGTVLTCAETVTNSAGASTAPSINGTVVGAVIDLPVAPVNVAPPTIDGTAQEGRTVTCLEGSWLSQPTSYAYSWQRGGVAIAGATARNYEIGAGDVAQPLTCRVVATNASGSSLAALSLPVVPLGAGVAIPFNVSPPTIGGTAQAGSTVTCAPGSWVPANPAFAYVWKLGGSAIDGATNATHLVTASEVGGSLTCTVTATNDFGSSRATSAAVVPTGAAGGGTGGGGGGGTGGGSSAEKPANVTAPALSGTAVVGKRVRCSRGTWTASPTAYLFRWIRGNQMISGQTGPSYKIQPGDVRTQIGCAVAAGNNAGYGQPALSGKVTPTAKADAKRPSVTKFKFKPRKLTLKKPGKTRRKGALTWKLSEAAWVTIKVERKVAGLKKGKRCKKATKKQLAKNKQAKKKRKRCTIWKRAGKVVAIGKPGANKLAFRGKVGKRKLRIGAYRAKISAVDAARNTSRVRKTKLTLAKPKPKPAKPKRARR